MCVWVLFERGADVTDGKRLCLFNVPILMISLPFSGKRVFNTLR